MVTRREPHRKLFVWQLYCCVCNRYLGTNFSDPLPSKCRLFWCHYSGFRAVVGTHRQKGNLVHLLKILAAIYIGTATWFHNILKPKIRRGKQTNGHRWTCREREREREKGDLISLLLFFQRKQSKLKKRRGKLDAANDISSLITITFFNLTGGGGCNHCLFSDYFMQLKYIF
jgi:hypothetical protein